MAPRRRPEDIARHGANGTERCCRTCHLWLPQDADHFYRTRGGKGWQTECKPCAVKRDLKRYLAKRGTVECPLAEVLGLVPK